jgi:hypothetical protein
MLNRVHQKGTERRANFPHQVKARYKSTREGNLDTWDDEPSLRTEFSEPGEMPS